MKSDSMILEDNKFKLSIYCSLFLHILFLVMLYVGTPSFYEEYKQEPQLVSFEMLPASTVMNLPQMINPELKKAEKKTNPKTAKKKAPKEVKKAETEQKPEPKTEQKSEAKSEPVTKSEPVKEKKSEQENIQKVPVKPKVEEDKPIEKKDKPKNKTQEKLKDKPKNRTEKSTEANSKSKTLRKSLEEPEASKVSPFDALDSEDDNEQEDIKLTKDIIDEKNFSTSQLYDEFNPLSITETMLIRRQIEQHWSPPVGLDSASGVRVMISLKLTKAAGIKRLEVKNVICPKGDIGVCRLVAESTLRAVRKAMPIKGLSVDRYDIWGEFDLLFDPQDLL